MNINSNIDEIPTDAIIDSSYNSVAASEKAKEYNSQNRKIRQFILWYKWCKWYEHSKKKWEQWWYWCHLLATKNTGSVNNGVRNNK